MQITQGRLLNWPIYSTAKYGLKCTYTYFILYKTITRFPLNCTFLLKDYLLWVTSYNLIAYLTCYIRQVIQTHKIKKCKQII